MIVNGIRESLLKLEKKNLYTRYRNLVKSIP